MFSSKHLTVIYSLCYLLFLASQTVVAVSEKSEPNVVTSKPKISEKPEIGHPKPSDKGNVSVTTQKSFGDYIDENRGMLTRAMYVTIAISGILIVYFGIRFVRARRRKVRRYGRLRTSGENLEMARLASNSDEDDTLFDAKRTLMQ